MKHLFTAMLLCLPGLATAQVVEDLHNFHAIDASLSTAGQVTDEMIPALVDEGYELVINLAVADEKRNATEAFKVTQSGIAYAQIPVLWKAPKLSDLDLFFAMMDSRGGRKTLVHCFANYRASAFIYLYRTLRLGVAETGARQDLDALWTEEVREKNPVWVQFMREAQAHWEKEYPRGKQSVRQNGDT
jgi:protein tyrosine phosphatase (PTP) superfamily phosphohydrolase (DUF442 family)